MRRCKSARWGKQGNERYELEFPGCVRSLRAYILHALSPRLRGFNFYINAEHALKGVHK